MIGHGGLFLCWKVIEEENLIKVRKIKNLRVPQRGQHSPSGTVALAHGIRGQVILRHTVTDFWTKENIN